MKTTPDMAWPIETDDQVEALARECDWDNRKYMGPAEYAIWCERMRKFARLAALSVPAAEVVGEPAWWIVTTDMGKVIFHGPDKERADRVAAIHSREAQPLYAATCDDTAIRAHAHLICCFADEMTERNWADKALYIKQQVDRLSAALGAKS